MPGKESRQVLILDDPSGIGGYIEFEVDRPNPAIA
jgi:hypothetical protein